MGPSPYKARAFIRLPRQLDLQLTLFGRCAQGEDFQNHAGAINDLGAPCLFKVTLLNGRKARVDDNQIRLVRFDHSFDVGKFAFAKKLSGANFAYRDYCAVFNCDFQSLPKTDGFFQIMLGRAGFIPRCNGMDNNGARRGLINFNHRQQTDLIKIKLFFGFIKQDTRDGGHNRRNSMFVDKLHLTVAAQKHAKAVKPGHNTL